MAYKKRVFFQKSTAMIWKKDWINLQDELARNFHNSQHVIAEKSDHMIPWKQPELIVDFVKQMCDLFQKKNQK